MTTTSSSRNRSDFQFRPTAPLENIRRRAILYRVLRAFFDEKNYLEVSTPTLSRDVVVDRFVESVPVELKKCWIERDEFAKARFANPDESTQNATTFYLQTSPEFAMKRLLAAGMDAIYQMTPAYRQGDRGDFHNVEFTMLEWYRRDVAYEAGRAFLASLIETVSRRFYDALNLGARAPFQNCAQETTFADAFLSATRLDPFSATVPDLVELAKERNVPYPESYLEPDGAEKDDWLDLIFSELVQPNLGSDAPTIVYDYPGDSSQLAQTAETDGRIVARRFELFVEGVELANGYDELTNPDVLRDRVQTISQARQKDGSPTLPRESRLLAAMDAGYPASSGCALGVDRFLMVLIGATNIGEVVAFPTELA